ncbi:MULTISPECIES: hypothetical protein [unclassified Streptomyces]|uniref:hypothetical protein n=1 Tax=unclassified Streptomyces TaxID=2593676 RepID=UPI003D71EBF3
MHAAFQDPLTRRWHARAAGSAAEAADRIGDGRAEWARERTARWAVVDADTGLLLGRAALCGLLLGSGFAEGAHWTVAGPAAGASPYGPPPC